MSNKGLFLFELLFGDSKDSPEESIEDEFIKKGEQEDFNFEEEDLEEDDYHYEDD